MPSKALQLELLAHRSRDRPMRLVATVEEHRERVGWAWVVVGCCTSIISRPVTNMTQTLRQSTMLPALMLLDP